MALKCFEVKIMDHYDCLRIRLNDVCLSALSGDFVVDKCPHFTQNEKSKGCSVYPHSRIRSQPGFPEHLTGLRRAPKLPRGHELERKAT